MSLLHCRRDSREGLTMGPYAGGIAARAVLGLDPGIDLTPFDSLR